MTAQDAPPWAGASIDLDAEWWSGGERVRVFDLAHRMETGMPRHPNHPPYAFTLTKQHGEVMYPDGISASAELITTGGHVGTHVDALGHVSKHGRIFGGESVLENQSYAGGLRVGSVELVPPLIGRGHLVDAVALRGRPLEAGEAVTVEDLEQWFADRPEPSAGSIVLVHTGWEAHWNDFKTFLGQQTGTPGVDAAAGAWLSARGILAAGGDSMVFEQTDPDNVKLPVHIDFLIDHGIYIMEAMRLGVLAKAKAYEFTFFGLPLRIGGGTGSPLRPIAVIDAPAS